MPHEVGATNNGVRVGHAERERSQPFAAQGNDRPKIDQLIRTRIVEAETGDEFKPYFGRNPLTSGVPEQRHKSCNDREAFSAD